MLSLWEHNPPQLEPLRANMRQVEPEVLPPQLTSHFVCFLVIAREALGSLEANPIGT